MNCHQLEHLHQFGQWDQWDQWDEEDLQKALEIIEDFGKASGLKVNIDKSEIMCFGD